jgi:RNA polymerase sigma-70 factor (ECF subfamily)
MASGVAARDGALPDAEPPEPVDWLTPEHSLHVKRLCGAFVEAVGALPERQAQALVMGEIAGVETERLCRKLGVTRGNLWVLLHRARSALRAGLEERGYSFRPS